MHTSCSAATAPNCRLWITVLFPLQTLGVQRSMKRLCTQNTHTPSLPHHFDWLQLLFHRQAAYLFLTQLHSCRILRTYAEAAAISSVCCSTHHSRQRITCEAPRAAYFARRSSSAETCAAFSLSDCQIVRIQFLIFFLVGKGGLGANTGADISSGVVIVLGS